MKIGFIGAGKVGFSLGKYFSINNIEVSGYYSKTLESAKEAAQFTNSKFYTDLKDFLNDTEFIFITTPDDFISTVWNDLKNYYIKDKIICHCSGSISSEVFSNISNFGAYGYSLHAMYAFSDKYTSYKDLNSAYFSLEGDSKYLSYIESLIKTLGNEIIIIEKEKKYLYHLASVTVANLTLALLNTGVDYLSLCGVDKNDALKALLPLIKNNLNNIEKKGFVKAVTGPVDRNDIGTITNHLSVIPKEDILLYTNLSNKLVKLCKEKNPDKNYSQLETYLGGYKDEKHS